MRDSLMPDKYLPSSGNRSSLASQFEAHASLQPNSPALSLDGSTLSYENLNARANQFAAHLRELGVGPESLVGIHLDRSFDLIAGIFAILKAGGAYLPLDLACPEDRLTFMLEDSRAQVVLTESSLAARFANYSRDGRLPRPGSRPARKLQRGERRHRQPNRITSPTSSTPRARPARPRAAWSRRKTSRAFSPRPIRGFISARRMSGRFSTPARSTFRSGKSSARCFTADGSSSCPTWSAARPRLFASCSSASASPC